MTEKTVIIDALGFTAVSLLAPLVPACVLALVCVLVPPMILTVALVSFASIGFGYVSYLVLGVPLMALAHWAGIHNFLFHAGVGFVAVHLIPLAHAAGMPLVAEPGLVEAGVWFGPLWCATAALLFNGIRHKRGCLGEAAI